ncbi:hypothetical protein E3N88_23541 [Mikania micrantha]|uniref:Reticulon-like protein n=1 Tax=Mikania micrantha TaxID=192012 RepID=A0A5N6NF76_9ASTR|nr:hypothetical protein E3N88_23541 [Mikania micrantha]
MADNAAGEHEHESPSFVESVKEKISETFHKDDSSSSESDCEGKKSSPVSDVKDKIYRLFGRERPVHKLLGGGKGIRILICVQVVDELIKIILTVLAQAVRFRIAVYRNSHVHCQDKKVSGGVVGFATLIWVLFELVEYHLLTLVCHTLILALAVLFLWSNASSFINKSAPRFPEVVLPEDIVLGVASALRIEINRALVILRSIALGKDLKKFLAVIAGLWVLSILGSCWNFLTLLYTGFILLHTVPYIYDKYEDKVDAFGEKAEAEIKKQYAVFNVKTSSLSTPLPPLLMIEVVPEGGVAVEAVAATEAQMAEVGHPTTYPNNHKLILLGHLIYHLGPLLPLGISKSPGPKAPHVLIPPPHGLPH